MKQRKYSEFVIRIIAYGILLGISTPLLALIADSMDYPFSTVACLHLSDWKLFLNTLLFSLTAIAVSTLIALPVAYILGTFHGYLGRFLGLLLISPIMMPSYIYALLWQEMLQIADLPSEGVLVAFFIEVLVRFPLLLMAAFIGFASIPSALLDAGKIFIHPVLYLFRVILPLIRSHLSAGVSLSVLFSINDYALPSVFMRHTYALEIFARYSAVGKGGESFLYALPLIILSILLSYILLYLVPKLSVGKHGDLGYDTVLTGPIGFDIYKIIAISVAVLQFIVPMFAILFLIIKSSVNVFTILDIQSLQFSLIVSLLSIIIVFPLAWFMAEYLYRNVSSVIWIVILFLFALPSSMIGSGTILFWGWTGVDFVYGHWPLLLFGYMVKLFPLFTMLIYLSIKNSDTTLWNAALLYKNGLGLWLKVRLFLIWPGIAIAFLLGLSMTLSEIVLSLLLAPAGTTSVGIRIFNYLHYGAVDQVAYLISIIMLLAMLWGGILYLLLTRHKSRRE